jgi:plastocyanin
MLLKRNKYLTRRWFTSFLLGMLCLGALPQAIAQSEQQIIVTIRNYMFETTQMPLQLHVPTVIHLRNADDVRHDFGSLVFEGSHTRVEGPTSISYGKGIGGVYIEPGGEVSIRFTIDSPGRYQFKCSIHEGMEGEILLMSAGAV